MAKHGAILDFMKHLHCPAVGGAQFTYSHPESLAEFSSVFAEVIEDDLQYLIACSPFETLIIDESTDVSVQKRLYFVHKSS